ncbi:hypothetical protein OIV83_003896 [Microbotryomycetes sp. JL201]|nr:hypothetical protein OIV83_003896 [Microbotryomycetes sp. JL201]
MPRVIGLGQGTQAVPPLAHPNHATVQSQTNQQQVESRSRSQLQLKPPPNKRRKEQTRAGDNARTNRLLGEARDEIRRLTKLYELLQVRLIAKGLDPVEEITRFHIQLDTMGNLANAQAKPQQNSASWSSSTSFPNPVSSTELALEGSLNMFNPPMAMRHPAVARLANEYLTATPAVPQRSLGFHGQAGDITVTPLLSAVPSPLASLPPPQTSVLPSTPSTVPTLKQGLPLTSYTMGLIPRKTRKFDRKAFKVKGKSVMMAGSPTDANIPLQGIDTIANKNLSSSSVLLPPFAMTSASLPVTSRPLLPPLRISNHLPDLEPYPPHSLANTNQTGDAAMESAQTLLQLSSASSSGGSGHDLPLGVDPDGGSHHNAQPARDGNRPQQASSACLSNVGDSASPRETLPTLPSSVTESATAPSKPNSYQFPRLPRLEIPSPLTRECDDSKDATSSSEHDMQSSTTTSAVPLSAWIRGSAVDQTSMPFSQTPSSSNVPAINTVHRLSNDRIPSQMTLNRYSKPLTPLSTRSLSASPSKDQSAVSEGFNPLLPMFTFDPKGQPLSRSSNDTKHENKFKLKPLEAPRKGSGSEDGSNVEKGLGPLTEESHPLKAIESVKEQQEQGSLQHSSDAEQG